MSKSLWGKHITKYGVCMYLDCATSAQAEVPWVPETFLASFLVSVRSSDPGEKLGHLWIQPSAEDLSVGILYRSIPLHVKPLVTQGTAEG